jgi:hypothetical protein
VQVNNTKEMAVLLSVVTVLIIYIVDRDSTKENFASFPGQHFSNLSVIGANQNSLTNMHYREQRSECTTMLHHCLSCLFFKMSRLAMMTTQLL